MATNNKKRILNIRCRINKLGVDEILHCGLLGRNIQYSKSPEIHNKYYKEHNLDLQYELFDVEEKDIPNFINTLNENNIIGFNVTIPYKQKIIRYLSSIESPADKIGAVNTVLVKGKELVGYNTDYYGFLYSIKEKQINLTGKSALIIGSGGSAQCVYYALKHLGVSNFHVLSRNITKASSNMPKECSVLSYGEDTSLNSYDIIINCTPIGGPNFIHSVPIRIDKLKEDAVVFDLNYIPEKSELLKEAEKLGANIINGSTMLRQQAYYAIKIWNASVERGNKKR